MSWYKITFPLTTVDNDPKVVDIGRIAWEVFERENRPKGFGMLHATRGSFDGLNDLRLVYLSPVAAELCTEVREKYPMEPCDVPACDEPDIYWIMGDPLVKNELKPTWEPEPGSVEAARAEAKRAELERGMEEYARLEALAKAKAEEMARAEAAGESVN
ncbi:MAG TPA: hypothetical protein VFR78_10880 [Pyrinomonadaceae bacterium]|nr:hypothetical protein [Pyrinomonadaceae bacterium]